MYVLCFGLDAYATTSEDSGGQNLGVDYAKNVCGV